MPNPPTPRMGLTRPFGSESMGSGATSASTVLTNNYNVIDKCVGVLSSNTPNLETPMYEGRMFFEPPNNEYWFRETSFLWPIGSRPKNQLPYRGNVFVDVYPNVTTQIMGPKITFSASNTRRYLVRFKCFNRNGGGVDGTRAVSRIYYAAGSDVDFTGTLVETVNLQLPQDVYGKVWSSFVELPNTLNGTYTVGWSLELTGGGSMQWRQVNFEVQEIGQAVA